MGTKAQMIDFIIENFEDPNSEGKEVSKSKLDALKKADLENFIKEKASEEEFINWLANK